MLTEALEIHFIDMVKFRSLTNRDILNDPLQRWLTYFDKTSPQELVEEVIKMDVAIQKADTKMRHVAIDEDALRWYEVREKALSDLASGIAFDRKEGRKEAAIEIARNLKSLGTPIETIAQATALTEQQIRDL